MKRCDQHGRHLGRKFLLLKDLLDQEYLGGDVDGLDKKQGNGTEGKVGDHHQADAEIEGRVHQQKEDDVLAVIAVHPA